MSGASLTCQVCDIDLGADPCFVGTIEEPFCERHCVECNPCVRCDGEGVLRCDHHGTGVDCGCALWECPDCEGTGVDNGVPDGSTPRGDR